MSNDVIEKATVAAIDDLNDALKKSRAAFYLKGGAPKLQGDYFEVRDEAIRCYRAEVQRLVQQILNIQEGFPQYGDPKQSALDKEAAHAYLAELTDILECIDECAKDEVFAQLQLEEASALRRILRRRETRQKAEAREAVCTALQGLNLEEITAEEQLIEIEHLTKCLRDKAHYARYPNTLMYSK